MTPTLLHQHLDDILAEWHRWQCAQPVTRGFASRALVCGEYQISRQYDDQNGALDSDLQNSTMKTVDFQVQQMLDPHKAAVYAQARSLACGVSVWTSARLPGDKEQRAVIVAEARMQITKRLQNAGVL